MGEAGPQAPSCPPSSSGREFPPRSQVSRECPGVWCVASLQRSAGPSPSLSGSCQSWKAQHLVGGEEGWPGGLGEEAACGEVGAPRKSGDERASAPRAPGFLLCLRPVCSAFLRFLGGLSRALEKPRFTGACLCTTTRGLRENTHYKQSHSALIFSCFGVHGRFLTGRWKRKRFHAAKTTHSHPRPSVTLASVRRTPGAQRRWWGRFCGGRGVLSQQGMEGRSREPPMPLSPLASASLRLGPTGEVLLGRDG